MKIARIHFPTLGNNGDPLYGVIGVLEKRLMQEFGGFTYWNAQGAWKSDNGRVYKEPVTVYEVAYEGYENHDLTIRGIAVAVGRLAEQEAVFVIIDGNAEILDCKI